MSSAPDGLDPAPTEVPLPSPDPDQGGGDLDGLTDPRRILLLMGILVFVALAASGLAIATLQGAAVTQQRAMLTEVAQSQARLIEAVAAFDARHSADFPGGAPAATLAQIRDAQANYRGFGETGEFTLARRASAQIEFLMSHRHASRHGVTIPWASSLAEPMRAALQGRAETLIGRDYRGVRVLAATEPIAGLPWGLVAKIDLSELYQPFREAALLVLSITLLLAGLGAWLFFRLTNPLIRKLIQSEARFRALFSAAPLGIALVDDQGRPALSNPALQDLLGYDAEALAAKPFPVFTHPEDVDKDLSQYRALWRGEIPSYSMEKRYLRADGGLVWAELTVALVRRGDGRPLGAIGMVEDIGQRRAMEQQLRRALSELEQAYDKSVQMEKLSALGTFVGGIAHEIKNPLMGLSNCIDHVDAHLDEGELKEVLADARHAMRRIGGIVDGILTYADADRGCVGPVDIASAVREVCTLVNAEMLRHQILLRVDLPERLPHVATDRGVLERALLNLLLNAAYAVRERELREIRISAEAGQSELRIAVADSGPGIPPALRSRIYDPFFTTKPPGQGTGLGLSLALRQLTTIGGELELDPTYAAGARFIMRLPLVGAGSSTLRK